MGRRKYLSLLDDDKSLKMMAKREAHPSKPEMGLFNRANIGGYSSPWEGSSLS